MHALVAPRKIFFFFFSMNVPRLGFVVYVVKKNMGEYWIRFGGDAQNQNVWWVMTQLENVAAMKINGKVG